MINDLSSLPLKRRQNQSNLVSDMISKVPSRSTNDRKKKKSADYRKRKKRRSSNKYNRRKRNASSPARNDALALVINQVSTHLT